MESMELKNFITIYIGFHRLGYVVANKDINYILTEKMIKRTRKRLFAKNKTQATHTLLSPSHTASGSSNEHK